jgi:Flp pilus assembly protein TadB
MTVPTAVRVGNDDRNRTATLLGLALTQGYLEMADYEQRLQTAFAAQTNTELHSLTADLPVATLRRNDPARQAERRRAARRGVRWHLAGYLTMVVIVRTVWLAVGLTAGAWYFWPIWPILGAGLGVLGHALPMRVTARSVPPGWRSGSAPTGPAAPAWRGCSPGAGRRSWR